MSLNYAATAVEAAGGVVNHIAVVVHVATMRIGEHMVDSHL
jgi:hypothetical protein